MRVVVPLNHGWLYAPTVLDDRVSDDQFESVILPHTNIELPHHNFDNLEYQFTSTYRKRFTLPEARNGRRVYLDFEGAMTVADVMVNGQHIGTHGGGYTPFSFDITDALVDGENLLTVRLDSSERADIPPNGYVVDYLTFGGIYREVSLRMVEPCYIADVFVRPSNVLSKTQQVDVDITIHNQSESDAQVLVSTLLDLPIENNTTVQMHNGIRAESLVVKAGAKHTVTLSYNALPAMALWTPENPVLHKLNVMLGRENSEAVQDEQRVMFGLREARFDKDGNFYLNGEPLKLRGLNRHQTFPYIGGAAPARLQRRDADIVKYELGCNIVRTSHYPQSKHFIQRCDEIGLLVFEEIPGWQFIGDDDWKALSLRDVEAMIMRDRNHPSIILWGVRINESPDDDQLYAATNALAHKLDPTRQTGGVRNFIDSNMLEDVFTYNDFSNTVIDPIHTPHMVTEFNGHMFPTKTWDNEERAVEHAVRHARVQNAAAGNPRVAGAIGWCAFDYNTHREFGSGDRICYHGVMDIFRLPKFAADFYASQQSPAQKVVMEAASYWTMGDRSEGGNEPLVIFSNCDEIEVFLGEASLGRHQPDRETYPHLPHPPYTITGLGGFTMWGMTFPELHLVGYINGEVVLERRYEADGLPRALELTADDTELIADGSDMTRLVFRIVDKYGNRLPFSTQPVTFEIEGAGTLVGENPFALVGGQAAVYVRAGQEAGEIRIRATTPRLPAAEVTITVR